MKKRMFCVSMMLLAVAIVVCGCAGQQTQQTSAADTAAATTAATTAVAATSAATEAPAAEKNPYGDRIKITHNITDADRIPGTPMYEWFSDKFNVDIEFIPMQFGERHEKFRIWCASNDLPDLMWMDMNENIYTEWCQYADSGLFAPLPSDLSRWPNIKNVFDSYISDDILTRDGKVYAYAAKRDMDTHDYMVCLGYAYRADWAEAVGMRKEDDVYTWQEWWDLVKEVIDKDPGGNGAGKTFGVGAPQFYFPDCFGIWQTTTYEWGFEEPFFMLVDGEYRWYPTLPEYYIGLKAAKQKYDEGLIWNDIVTDTNSSVYNDLYYAGQMFSVVHHVTTGAINGNRTRMIEAFPDGDRELMYMPAKVSSPVDDTFYWQKQSPHHWGANSFSAGVSEEQMNRVLDMFDWLMTDEGMNFRFYGIEGKDYKIGADGKVEVLWEKNAAGNYIDPYQSGSRGFYGRPILADAQNAFKNVTIPEADRRDGQKSWDWDGAHAHVGYVDYIALYASTPKKDELGMFVAETKAKAIELIANSTVDKIEEEMRAWTQTMMPRVQQVLDELNALDFKPNNYAELVDFLKSNPIPNYNR